MWLSGGGGSEAGDPLRFIRPAVGAPYSPAHPRGLMNPAVSQIHGARLLPAAFLATSSSSRGLLSSPRLLCSRETNPGAGDGEERGHRACDGG